MAKKSVNNTTSDDAPWVTTAALPAAARLPLVAPGKAVHQVVGSIEVTSPDVTLNLRGSCLITRTMHGLHGYQTLSTREFPLGTQVRRAQSKHKTFPHADVSAEIARDYDAGCILGPFEEIPLPNLKCSGMGVVRTVIGG